MKAKLPNNAKTKATDNPAAKPKRGSATATLTTLRALTKTAKAAKSNALAVKKKRLSELLALIVRRKNEIVEAFYDIGEALHEIHKHKLYRAEELPTLDAFLKKHALMSRSTAYKLMKVVESVSRSEALKLGQERAFALVAYTEATPELDSPAKIAATNDLVAGKRLKEARTSEIRAATKRLKESKAKATRTPKERAAEKQRTALTQTLRAAHEKLGIKRAEYTAHESFVLVKFTFAQIEALGRAKK